MPKQLPLTLFSVTVPCALSRRKIPKPLFVTVLRRTSVLAFGESPT